MHTMKAVSHVNTEMLEWCMWKKHISTEKLATLLNIPVKRLEGLLNGKYEFYVQEIISLRTILSISDSQMRSIFFLED